MTYRHIIHMVSNYRNIVKVTGSNNFAITSAELGEGLQESASAIVAAGKQYCLNIQKCILRIHLIARYS